MKRHCVSLVLMAALSVPSFSLAAGSGGQKEEQKTAEQDSSLNVLERLQREEDFKQSLDVLLPLTEEEIREVRRKTERIESAIEPGPARMRTESRQLHVTPGAAPQVIRLTAGYSSTLVFQDVTGAAWPVLSIVLGSPSAFTASQPRVERDLLTESQAEASQSLAEARNKASNAQKENLTSNIINIVPMTARASSNLVVNLQDCPYPVILHLLTDSPHKGSRSSDALVVFRLDKGGPNAEMPKLGPGLPETVTPELLGFVHGVPPSDAVMLDVTPEIPGLRVWKYGGKIYLRTSNSVVWPAWQSVAGGDDMRVYVLPPTQSLVISIDGNHQKIVIPGGR